MTILTAPSDEIVTLVWRTETGEDRRDVYGTVESVGANEYFNAAKIDLKPEYRVTVWADEYDGEPFAVLNGRRYTIYRTYLNQSGKVELYLTGKAGNHER